MIILMHKDGGGIDVRKIPNKMCAIERTNPGNDDEDDVDQLWVESETGSMGQEPWVIGKVYVNSDGDELFVDYRIVNADY